jgi:predicted GIY-YIG superfamily endonuclease/restriction endonuclease S subunit
MSEVVLKNKKLPLGWEEASIVQVATISTGKRDANHAENNGAYTFFTCAFAPLKADTFAFDDEALLLPGNGHNVGEVFYYKGKFEAYQRTYVIHEIKVLPKYLFYHLKYGWRKATDQKQYGTATNYIRIGNFHDYRLPVAPPEQQKRIVAKIEELFSHIDAGIAALNKAKQLLKQYRQSVLKAAVTGELTKHLPSRQAGWRDPLFRNKCGKLVPKNSDKYFAYVLECENGSLYKGFSKNLYMRIDQHLSGQGAKWTKEHKPVSIIHFEEFETEKEAIEREKYFKSGSGREWINEIRDEINRRFEPASQLLERILQERRQKWEAQQLEQFKAKGKVPKDDGWKGKYKEPLGFNYDGELPEIPDTWSWASPEQLASTDKYALSIGPFGSNLKVPDYRSSGVPLVFVRNIRRHEYGLVGGKFVTSEKAKELKAHAISGGDVLITKMGEPPGDASIYPAGSPDAIITADCIKWRFSQLIECPQLYVHATNSWLIKEQVVERTKGVAQKKISLGTFKSIAFPLAPLAEQQEILGEIEKKILSIARLEQDLELQLMKAEKNKQSILASAFSGEL